MDCCLVVAPALAFAEGINFLRISKPLNVHAFNDHDNGNEDSSENEGPHLPIG